MYNPVSTYRLQFHQDFTLHNFEKIIPYLVKLGVKTIYASPVFESVPGSVHGYDGLNPHRINSEIGTIEQLKTIIKALEQQGIGWIQDIVPNHMAFDTRNPWLRDVLEKGRHSAYASFFDVDWNSPVCQGKLMAPFLGSSLEEAVQNGELQLIIEEGRMSFKCYDSFYPSNEVVYQLALNNLPEQLAQVAIDEKEYVQRFDDLKRSFSFLIRKNDTKHAIENILQAVNNNKEQLLQLLHQQHYQLCHWQETDRQINYRRFFTVNGLICLNMQEEHVFQYFHQLIKQMVDEGFWKGLRIDHVDGLFDPTQYLERLKNSAGENLYVTVEKILQPGESIPANWKVQGNTGYDFLAITNNLFTNRQNEKLLTDFYSSLVPGNNNFTQQLADKKSYILYHHMSGELENLFQLFLSQNSLDGEVQEIISKEDLKKAIGLFLIYCPVYRYYGNALPLQDQEAKAIGDIIDQIKQEEPALISALDILSAVLLKKPVEGNDDYNQRALKFYQRCMQFSGPLMAKGFEDTLMYTFNRFIVHNEVGDSPNAFGYNMDQFHQKMKDRQKQWPLSINTCSTHDTKMGEDVRARLNVLSDIAPLWVQQVKEWMEQNKELKKENGPDVNDEYFIYQALCGHYPMPGQAEDNFKDRLQEYLQKALREAKTHSNWTTPNEEYELATKTFAVKLLDKNKPFWKSFEKFQNLIVDFGIINSLVQVLLKCTCPGIPDIYQGTELWNLDFVDPDNRRPVDYEKRAIFLNELETNKDKNTVFQKIWQQRYSGKIKLWLTHRLLQLREQETSLFSEGEYMPLAVKGKYKENIIAFARTYRQTVFIIVAPLHIASLCMQQKKQWQNLDWKNTKISLPGNMLPVGESVFQSQKISLVGSVSIKTILQDLPFAVLKGEIIPNERGAGVLLHISSLPSPFGIGDMGPEAVAFADFLYCSYQKFWQLLPLNPTEEEQRHSPYSSTSARAGNTLLISPELLADDGFLNPDELRAFHLPQTGKTDYHATEEVKKKLFAKAWTNFKNSESAAQKEFHDFCDKEKSWLNNFALYMILKEEHEGKPWYEWAQEFKFRDKKALKKLATQNNDRLLKIKWLQYIFSKQWNSLKSYCNKLKIQLIGDMPFYTSYDSADVWANPEIFKLDEKGNRKAVAGVPPDAFSDDGQLWGMPVFRWDVLKKDNYKWWIERLKKNIELFDLVRLDHFRAFSAYWEVPAGEQTAKNGKWKKGPGSHFFKTIKNRFGELPFIAEDLGEIDEPVYRLRDRFHLPGMKVLQFAFGEDMGTSPHIPHNYKENFLVYTGTHDNNTTRGWWREGTQVHGYVEQYVGKMITEDEAPEWLCRMAYASTARIAILPMQDILGLDETARMNAPSSKENNWRWRLLPARLNNEAEKRLKEWTLVYNRG